MAALNVIALVSGGKDSFFSLLHCRANGHRVVALANLHPAEPAASSRPRLPPATPAATSATAPEPLRPPHRHDQGPGPVPGPQFLRESPPDTASAPDQPNVEEETDLNSFMYQTVGHQVLPLYADATGLPLYRRPILGGAGRHGKDYHAEPGADDDEAESMTALLRAVMAAHPEANAVSAGAILSTYQRTRVESVAVRLGLVPLAYLWKFPVLPGPGGAAGDGQLLDDMAAVGLEARIIKVASGGLDDGFLWTNIASPGGKARAAAAMRRFGVQETGAVIGEGGEFETLVLDGPGELFQKKIVVDEQDRRVVREGGGTAWLWLKNARVEPKDEQAPAGEVRIPGLLDAQFQQVLETLQTPIVTTTTLPSPSSPPPLGHPLPTPLQHWHFLPPPTSPPSTTTTQTTLLLSQLRSRLSHLSLPPTAILTATVLLRHMSDFPALNALYAPLFSGAPNPPSRVTISCGDALPQGVHVALSLTVCTAAPLQNRQGLHVQSRSYWAPANIGPYSQAVSVPAFSSGGGGLRMVHIAGQIPLVPASMALPAAEEGGVALQVTLALQHLARIALDAAVRVQWFAGGVAYFPHSASSSEEAREMARLAGRAWGAVHSRPAETEEDDDEDGPDLWDRRFNPLYSTLDSSASGGGGKGATTFPDWEVLGSGSGVPAFFAAEVEELPRGAGVEWQGHVGFAGVREGGVRVVRGEGWEGVVVDGGEEERGVDAVAREAVGGLGGEGGTPGVVVRYLDGKRCGEGYGGEEAGGLVVPVLSLWDAEGRGLVSVSVYQGFFEGV
ncbi:hypothetical protein QBC39DRAFT_392314 [Podospora conica]|nr:hypothetical protein QBC39DRAFT_392314 [Schizothecium conicum]